MQAPTHHVVWTASSGSETIDWCEQNAPDLVLVDLRLDGVDGVETTRRITARAACAVLIVTDDVQANAGRIFEAMGHGALDAVEMRAESGDSNTAPVLAKIATIARLIGGTPREPLYPAAPLGGLQATSLVAIGASAGGPPALAAVLRGLPADFPGAVVIVQHVDAQFALGMAAWLGEQTPLPVRVAAHGDRVTAGSVLLAGQNDHLVLRSAERFGYTREPSQSVYRPSIDVFFGSIIRHWRGDAVGVLLTGMGRDGAEGLRSMRTTGWYTIAQDETTSAVYGMPKAAAALDAAVDVLPVDLIAPRLVHALSRPAEVKM